MSKPDPLEWAKVNAHLQRVGSATCNVSSLILEADTMLEEEKNSRAAAMLMSAARDVLAHRRLARRHLIPLRAQTRLRKRA
jgi:hypothetical protein